VVANARGRPRGGGIAAIRDGNARGGQRAGKARGGGIAAIRAIPCLNGSIRPPSRRCSRGRWPTHSPRRGYYTRSGRGRPPRVAPRLRQGEQDFRAHRAGRRRGLPWADTIAPRRGAWGSVGAPFGRRAQGDAPLQKMRLPCHCSSLNSPPRRSSITLGSSRSLAAPRRRSGVRRLDAALGDRMRLKHGHGVSLALSVALASACGGAARSSRADIVDAGLARGRTWTGTNRRRFTGQQGPGTTGCTGAGRSRTDHAEGSRGCCNTDG
jgi:hypothetical protein